MQALDEPGPDTNRRLWTQGLQTEILRPGLCLGLLFALEKSWNLKETAAANTPK